MSALRKLKRNVAKVNMKRAGMRKICKKDVKQYDSWFSINWRDWIQKGKVK